ncbi:hypothetical protein BH10BDE1_BH10BDE1_07280 [soil metagenome]
MRARFNNVLTIAAILAIVVGAATRAIAAPTPVTPDLSTTADSQSVASPDEIERAKLVHPSPAEPIHLRPTENDYFYRYHRALSVRGGSEVALNDLENPGPTLGLLYWYPLRDQRGLEAGVDLSRDGFGTIHLGSRTVVGNERFRWFYKWGAGIRIVASDHLVTFVRPRNWQLRADGGFEVTLSDPISLRFDLDAIYGIERSVVDATLGLAFAW